MAPKSARNKQLAIARMAKNNINNSKEATINATRFVFSLLVNGSSYQSASETFLWNDIKVPSRATFYRIQPRVNAIITQMARESCQKYRDAMLPGSIIEMDGSWGHRRNSLQCILEFIDSRSKKIVDFEVTLKKNHSIEGDYAGSSNGMEIECLRKLIPRWIDDPNVSFFTHDNDSKTRSLLIEQGWSIQEIIDTNHSMKNFPGKIETFDRKNGGILSGLHQRLAKFLRYIIYLDIPLEEKEAMWLNCANHYAGDHSNCQEHGDSYDWPGKYINGGKEALLNFLKKTIKIIRKCNGLASTQLNESYHALKAKYANKDFCWIDSWVPRACAAILQFNEPNDWKFELYNRLELAPLSAECQTSLENRFIQAKIKSLFRRTPEYQIKEARRRQENKIEIAKNTTGIDLYKFKSQRKESKISNVDNLEHDVDFEIHLPSFDRDALETMELSFDEEDFAFIPNIEDFYFESDDEDHFIERKSEHRFEKILFNT